MTFASKSILVVVTLYLFSNYLETGILGCYKISFKFAFFEAISSKNFNLLLSIIFFNSETVFVSGFNVSSKFSSSLL